MKEDREEFDLIVIGGGVSATFLCLSIFKLDPHFKILIIERDPVFPRKIGESLVDMTALFVKSLEIEHLLEKHAVKSGVRFLFNEANSPDRSAIAEFASPTFKGRIKGYHLNRQLFDEQLLDEVKHKGVVVYRPAEIKKYDHGDFNNELDVECNGELKLVRSKWLVDASGRSRFICKALGWKDRKIDLNTGSIMAHFKSISPAENWDTKANNLWDTQGISPRKYSTTHLMRENSWWWIIRLDEVTTSIGVMFDKEKISFEDPEKYFLDQLAKDAQLSKMTLNAERGDIRYIESVPYVSERLYSKGVALIGDSGAFIDPLISPGLELIGQQSIWLAELITDQKKTGIYNKLKWEKYNNTFNDAYDCRLGIYKTAYTIIGSFDIFTSWLMQGNYVYFGTLVYPSIVFKKRFKYPLRFNFLERLALSYFKKRFIKIYENRMKQKRISDTKPNTLLYSGVRVPNDYRFVFIPWVLLFKSLWAYLKLEAKETPFLFRRRRRD